MEFKAQAHNSELKSSVRSKKPVSWLEIFRVLIYSTVRNRRKVIFEWDAQQFVAH